MLRTVDVYVAPNLGGESFGIILVEAMSAGAPVLASDLDSFARVLDGGRVGTLFPAGDVGALAESLLELLADEPRRTAVSREAAAWVRQFDWSVVADQLLAVYETVREGAGTVAEADVRPWRDRLRR